MKTRIIGIILAALAAVTLLVAPAQGATSWLSGHVQDKGTIDATTTTIDGHEVTEVGTTGQSKRLEEVIENFPSESAFTMEGHVQDIGWMPQFVKPDGRVAVGTEGRSLRLEAVRLKALYPGHITIWCQMHVQKLGWLPPVKDGATCGTTGKSLRAEKIRIWFVPKDDATPAPTSTDTPTLPPVEVGPVLSTVVTVGDVGLEASGRANLAAMGAQKATLALILGDLAYSPPAQTFCDVVRDSFSTPLGWVQGNHENRDADHATGDPQTGDDTPAYAQCMPTLDALGEPGVQQVISIPGARIITTSPQEVADSYAPGSPRWTWVRDQIRDAQADGVWPILAMHEPHYTPGMHGTAGPDSKALADLAIAEDVRLVLAAHDHVYGRITIDGTTFIVAGMGGHNPRTITTTDGWAATQPGASSGYLHLTIREHSITGSFAGVDDFQITRGE